MNKGYLQSAAGIESKFSARIDSLFSTCDRDRSPGATIAVISDGQIIHQRGYGVADVENDRAFSNDTVLRLGSTTKHLCATCLLILENRGQLALDDDIRQYVSELPEYESVISLRHLLTMSSGLWDGLNVLLFCGLDSSSIVTRQQMLKLIQCQRTLMFKPGDDCQYSNSNYALLSLVIERVSGKTLAEFMQDELFRPLGMDNSALMPFDTAVTDHKASGYVPTQNGALETGLMHVELCGDGGVDSTIPDMIRWFLNYKDDKLFGPNYRQRMEADNRLNNGRRVDYRLGINVGEYRSLRKIHHPGGMPGYLCNFVFYPDHDLGIILFANLFEPSLLDLPDRITDIVLGKKLSESLQSTFVSENDASAARLRGVFASEAQRLIVELKIDDGRLICYLHGNAHTLMAVGDHRFAPADQSFVLELPDTGTDIASSERPTIRFTSGCQPPVFLEPVSDPRSGHRPAATHLDALIGHYYSDELKEVHEITAQENYLCVAIPCPVRKLVWNKLVPIVGNLFCALIDGEASCTNVAAGFQCNGEATCRGLSYTINRCHDVQFRKLTLDPGNLHI